ncbi:DNA repair and recombination protein RadB [Candidatus Woesearchaeota archaeon]|nr:DNA repair and recombination protein RadB [Candidatus Woesearchaeota archaeon]
MDDQIISSGSTVMDQLLNGGYEVDVITTIYGPAGCGKTTLCMLAAIDAAKKGKKIIFVDTESGFSIARFKQLCDNLDLFQHIFVLKPTNFQEQMQDILKLKSLINDKIGLIIVDTIAMLYRLELGKHSEVKQVNNQLSIQLGYLTEIARKHMIPVLITNQVYSDFDERDSVRMVGGDLLQYGSKCLIELQKFRTKRLALVKKHRSIPEGKKTIFTIKQEGLELVEDSVKYEKEITTK